MVNIKLSEKGGNFMWRNILSHDPCHDWTPNGASKRLAKLNNSFIKFDSFTTTEDDMSVGGKKEIKNKKIMLGGAPPNVGISYNDLVYTNDTVGIYEEFDNDEDTFNVVYSYCNNSAIGYSSEQGQSNAQQIITLHFHYLLNNNELVMSEMNSTEMMTTRSKERNRRMCIAQVQKACEFNDYNRINVIGSLIPTNSLIESSFSGGREPLQIYKPYNDILSLNTEATMKQKEAISSKNTKIDIQKNTSQENEITSIFAHLKDELNNYTEFDEDITEEIKQKILDYYNFFEQSLLFYVKNIDSMLPLFAVVNSHFIKDSLFIFLINLLLYDKNETTEEITITKMTASDELFKEIVKMRNKDEKYLTFKQSNGGSRQSGGANIGTQELLNQISEEKMVDDFVNETNTLIPSDIYDKIQRKIFTIMASVSNDLFDPNIELNRLIQESIHMKLFDETNGFFIKKWQKDNCFHNITILQQKINDPLNNDRKRNRHIQTLNETISNIYISVHSALQKQYKLSSRQVTFISNSGSSTPSPTAVSVTNDFLATLTKGILRSSGPQYNRMKQTNIDGYENLYEKEAEMLKNVVKKGKVESNFDNNLLNYFVDCVKNKHPNNYIPCGIDDVISKLSTQLYDGPSNKINIKIINNAMTTKDGHGEGSDKLVNLMIQQNGFELICPVASIFDSQGTFGSCSSGTSSPGYINNNQNITITDQANLFELGFEVNKQTNKKTVMEYYAIYDGFTISDCIVEAVIQNKILNILSANNTFKLLLDFMETCWWELGGNINWTIFDYNPTNQKLKQLIKIASRKMMGDFGQELTSVTTNGGYSSISNWENILLTNGDQPSTVRAGYMLLNNVEGINSNKYPRTAEYNTRDVANVVFVTSKQGHIITGRPSSSILWGGKNRKNKRKTLKKIKSKQKTKKGNTLKKRKSKQKTKQKTKKRKTLKRRKSKKYIQ